MIAELEQLILPWENNNIAWVICLRKVWKLTKSPMRARLLRIYEFDVGYARHMGQPSTVGI